jgi:hypothetical protein
MRAAHIGARLLVLIITLDFVAGLPASSSRCSRAARNGRAKEEQLARVSCEGAFGTPTQVGTPSK